MEHCQNCGADCVETYEYISLKGDLGFEVKERIWKCSKCGTKHILCPECEGSGFHYHNGSFDDPEDCFVCHGMGVVETKNIKFE